MPMQHIKAAVRFDSSQLTRLEGELVRRGAREAHLTADGSMAVSVLAKSRADAVAFVNEFLEKALARRPATD